MTLKRLGLVAGSIAFIVFLLLPPFETFQDAAQQFASEQQFTSDVSVLARSMQTVAGLMILMVIWWITEGVKLQYTALLPLFALPFFDVVGVSNKQQYEFTVLNTAKNYFSPIVMLFFGGFLIAASMQKWKLDRRFTLWFLTRGNVAKDSRTTLIGLMAVTGFLSMWISNTATAAMMLPLALGILSYVGASPGNSRYGTVMMLGIAWAATIGGIGTLIGTPPNGIAIGILNASLANDPAYHRITFLDWMKFGVPYVILFLPVAWFLLLKMFPPEVSTFAGGKEHLLKELHSLGSMTRGELISLSVFCFAVVLWVTTPFVGLFLSEAVMQYLRWLDEYTIGLMAGLLLFALPVKLRERKFALHWRDLKFVEWSALIITGGGIALSDVIFRTGFASWLSSSFVHFFGSPPTIVMMAAVALFTLLLTEIASNSAVTSMVVPVVLSIAAATGGNAVALALAATLSATAGFMLPVGTPPNALVYGTGYIQLKDMIKAGFILDILGWLFTVGILVIFGWLIFGVISL
jgi:sodium-dependent dicarboxylate transporter 2/3/5